MSTSSPDNARLIPRLLVLSFSLGLYISYYLSFISAIFIKTAGVKNLPIAYISAGIGGTLFTRAFNYTEQRWGFFRAALGFITLITLSVALLWFAFAYGELPAIGIISGYAWFWISSNFLLLIFWKIPPLIFDLDRNKKNNPVISSGEVVSAILAYISIPLLLSSGLIKSTYHLMLIAVAALIIFLIVLLSMKNYLHAEQPAARTASSKTQFSFQQLLQKPFFKVIFSAMLVSFAVRFLVDYTAMLSTATLFQDTSTLAAFLAIMFGTVKLLEILFKIFIAGRLFNTYGISAGLLSISIVLMLTSGISLLNLITGTLSLSLVLAIINKVLERSINNALYTPAQNILYHAFPPDTRSSAQNFGDGYGKTYGQLLAGILIFLIALVEHTLWETIVLMSMLLLLLLLWNRLSLAMISHYRNGLSLQMFGHANTQNTQSSDSPTYLDKLNKFIQHYAATNAALADLDNPRYQPVYELLLAELLRKKNDLFGILAEKYDPRTVQQIGRQIQSDNRAEKVIATEVLELMLNTTEKNSLLPIIRDFPPEMLFRKLEADFPQVRFSPKIRLFSIASQPTNNTALRLTAIKTYAQLYDNQDNLLSGLCFCPNHSVAELAHQLLQTVSPAHFPDVIRRSGYALK
jgi:hypothetical protein